MAIDVYIEDDLQDGKIVMEWDLIDEPLVGLFMPPNLMPVDNGQIVRFDTIELEDHIAENIRYSYQYREANQMDGLETLASIYGKLKSLEVVDLPPLV